jgi:hypothetical protein
MYNNKCIICTETIRSCLQYVSNIYLLIYNLKLMWQLNVIKCKKVLSCNQLCLYRVKVQHLRVKLLVLTVVSMNISTSCIWCIAEQVAFSIWGQHPHLNHLHNNTVSWSQKTQILNISEHISGSIIRGRGIEQSRNMRCVCLSSTVESSIVSSQPIR